MGCGLYVTLSLSGHAESATRGLLYFFGGLSLSFAAMTWLAVAATTPERFRDGAAPGTMSCA
jgi:hypothetical protein